MVGLIYYVRIIVLVEKIICFTAEKGKTQSMQSRSGKSCLRFSQCRTVRMVLESLYWSERHESSSFRHCVGILETAPLDVSSHFPP